MPMADLLVVANRFLLAYKNDLRQINYLTSQSTKHACHDFEFHAQLDQILVEGFLLINTTKPRLCARI
jgi:hypothetical protein